MPFTPAHPAIVLPFLGISSRRVSASALVIGSMSPDFEYFFKMSVNSTHSHTLPGVLYFDVPVTLLLMYLFHEVVKKRLYENLPPFLQRRYTSLLHYNFRTNIKANLTGILICSALGALSHIFWDAFTHNDGYFAQHISLYDHVVVPFDGVRYPLFYALQHISTFTGMTIIIFYVMLRKKESAIGTNRPSFVYWMIVFIVILIVLSLRFGFYSWPTDIGNVVVSSITAFLLGLIVASTIYTKRLIHG